MKKILPLVFFATITLIATDSQAQNEKMKYPETRKGDVVDNYFGTDVADPYRWLEDDRSTETEAWVVEQNKVTRSYLEKIPFRDQIKERLTQIWNYEKYTAPTRHGDYNYFYKNDGLQNQYVLYRQKGDDDPEVFLDPNGFSKDGTTSLSSVSFSKDGSKVAYSISEGGSDWRKIIIMDAYSREILGDTIVDVKFSGISWYKNEGLYYSSYDKPDGSELSAKTDQHKLYYHKLGTTQDQDILIFGDQIKRRYVGGYVTEDQNYLVVTGANSTAGNELYVKDLRDKDAELVTLVDDFEGDHTVLYSEGNELFISTNRNAANKKLTGF
jgi:prolyl oligopeptidase